VSLYQAGIVIRAVTAGASAAIIPALSVSAVSLALITASISHAGLFLVTYPAGASAAIGAAFTGKASRFAGDTLIFKAYMVSRTAPAGASAAIISTFSLAAVRFAAIPRAGAVGFNKVVTGGDAVAIAAVTTVNWAVLPALQAGAEAVSTVLAAILTARSRGLTWFADVVGALIGLAVQCAGDGVLTRFAEVISAVRAQAVCRTLFIGLLASAVTISAGSAAVHWADCWRLPWIAGPISANSTVCSAGVEAQRPSLQALGHAEPITTFAAVVYTEVDSIIIFIAAWIADPITASCCAAITRAAVFCFLAFSIAESIPTSSEAAVLWANGWILTAVTDSIPTSSVLAGIYINSIAIRDL
jgi:hypothetical protein